MAATLDARQAASTPQVQRWQPWLARLAFLAAAAALAVLLGYAGFKAVAAGLAGAAGAAVFFAAMWWFLTRRGLLRALALVLAVAAPVIILVLYAGSGLIWVILVTIGLWAVAVFAGRTALSGSAPGDSMPEYDEPPPARPFFIMNPRSGGGKVTKFQLADKARALGADVTLLQGPEHIDVAALARKAVDDGADLLGVAGGDGTQALVAGIAAERDVPFMVISAGTRNHFALDLGLDRDDPARCLDALRDGVVLRIDLGLVGDRTFVNNASFGAYAAVVQSPAYRDDKAGTTLDLLPDLLTGQKGPRLAAHADDVTVDSPQAVLVSNNPYGLGDIAGLGRRARLDEGVLGVLCIRVENAAHMGAMLAARRTRGLTALRTRGVTVDADTAEIPVGVDGEALTMPTPVRCTIRPGVLRVRVPRSRPGVPPAKAAMSWSRLGRLALGVGHGSRR